MIIAVDGPAAAGKGTLARNLARHYNLAFLDTGLLYRAVARIMLDGEIPLTDQLQAGKAAQTLTSDMLDDPRLRDEETGSAASVVSAYPCVRQFLLDFQRKFAQKPEGAVLDGRDIGTVIVPDADFKFYITASPEVRAARRYKELLNRGKKVIFEDVLADVIKRDERDANRLEAPLIPAQNAVILDTSESDAEQVFKKAVTLIEYDHIK